MGNKDNFKNKLTLVVLGRSGSGKGTQAEFILRRLGKDVRHLETGRFLRKIIGRSNPTAKIARKVMRKGGLLPAWLAAYTWLKELIEKGHADKHLVYDGAPRRIWEAELIDNVTEWHGRSLPLCIYIDATPANAIKRLLLRGRTDDKVSAIRNRMRFFTRDVLPVIRYFKKNKRLLRINGNPPPEVVWFSLERALSKRLGKLWPKSR